MDLLSKLVTTIKKVVFEQKIKDIAIRDDDPRTPSKKITDWTEEYMSENENDTKNNDEPSG